MVSTLLLLVFSKCTLAAVAKCNVPPALWCQDESISNACGVFDACSKYNATVWGENVRLTLLYETLCPDCQEFIVNVLHRYLWSYGRDFINFELVPYGNAKRSLVNGTWQIACQHGPTECMLNRLHGCAVYHLSSVQRWMPFVVCMEEAAQSHKSPKAAAKLCLTQVNATSKEEVAIMKCTTGAQGRSMQIEFAQRTEGIQPNKHRFVPWILINNQSTNSLQAYQSNLFQFLCQWHRGNLPKGCEQMERMSAYGRCLCAH